MRRQTAASGGRWRGGDGSVAAAWWVGVVVLGGHLLSCAQAGLLESNPGLAYNFYQKSCPSVDSIVRSVTWAQVAANPALPARLLRLHFHDCFVKMPRRSAAAYRALFIAARAPPVAPAPAPVPAPVPAPAPVPEPEVVASGGGEEEEPMDTGSPTPTPSTPTPVAVPIPQAATPVPPAPAPPAPAPPAPAPHASTGSAPTPQYPQVVPEMGWTSRNKFMEADEDAHYHTLLTGVLASYYPEFAATVRYLCSEHKHPLENTYWKAEVIITARNNVDNSDEVESIHESRVRRASAYESMEDAAQAAYFHYHGRRFEAMQEDRYRFLPRNDPDGRTWHVLAPPAGDPTLDTTVRHVSAIQEMNVALRQELRVAQQAGKRLQRQVDELRGQLGQPPIYKKKPRKFVLQDRAP